jgi:hypothetical protein
MGTLKNKEISNNDVSMITYFVFTIFILLLIIGICFIGIAISSKKDTESIISILNNVGGAIGGITSPIVGIISIVLVYMAYNQQLKANEYLKNQVDEVWIIEEERLLNIKNLIKTDLNHNIKPLLDEISKELKNNIYIPENWAKNSVKFNTYNHLNTFCFDSIDKVDLFKAMPSEFSALVKIYSNIEHIKKHSYYNLYLDYIKMFSDNRFVRDRVIVDSSKFEEIIINAENNIKLCNTLVDKYIDKLFPISMKEAE